MELAYIMVVYARIHCVNPLVGLKIMCLKKIKSDFWDGDVRRD